MIGIIASSILFYEYKKIDYKEEKELKEISEIISYKINGTNFHPTITKYIKIQEIPSEWPFLFHEMYKIKSISTNNYDNLENYIMESRKELSHLVIDNNQNLPKFLVEVYLNEEKYNYLKKEFDSNDSGFDYHVKLFKIDFEKFDINSKN